MNARQFWIRFRIGDNESTHQITDVSLNPLGKYPEDFHVIELAPMLKMMDEMAEAISNWKIQVETYGGDYLPGNYKQLITAHESYQAFKRENGLE